MHRIPTPRGLSLRMAALATALAAAAALTAAVIVRLELPPHFRAVSLERANQLLGEPGVGLVEAVEAGTRPAFRLPRSQRWQLGGSGTKGPEVPEAGVLVVAIDAPAGRASAAALVRGGHRPVYLFVPDNDAERGALSAAALAAEEDSRGEDS
jgi:hypothetical protein